MNSIFHVRVFIFISDVYLNQQTGKSKHYGFIEFDSSAVAQIVADTMDNYLLMGHILCCKVIPKDEVHPELWVGANRKWRVVPKDRVARAEHDKVCRSLFRCVMQDANHYILVFMTAPDRRREGTRQQTSTEKAG